MAEPANYGGNVNPNDLATLSLLGGNGIGVNRGGYGELYHGNQVLAANAHADGSAVKESIDCNAKAGADAVAGIRQDFENATRDRQVLELSREHGALERRLADSVAALTAGANDARAEAARCCCETQKEIAREACVTRELINANALRVTERALDAADRESNTNSVANAITNQTALILQVLNNGNGHGGGHGG